MRRIAIVGGGLSGRLLLLNLLRQARSAVDIVMFDRRDAASMGPAYCDDAAYLLLNVPADRMGACADDPEHFLRWARARGHAAQPLDFLPRGLYRDYVLELQRGLLRELSAASRFEHVRAQVDDVRLTADGVELDIAGGETRAADSAVLALGNFPPRDPSIEHRAALGNARYVRNPWEPGLLARLSPDETVFLIGTGQTAVDLAAALDRRAHRGRIVALSRHGVLPLAHRRFDTYPSFFAEIRGSVRVLDVFRAVRRHVRHAESIGIDPRAVIDSLRPDTQSLWISLAPEEKRRFVRHAFRHWEIVRSRIPPQSGAIVAAMRASGRLAVVRGRIRDLVEADSALEVHYTERGATNVTVERAALVVNCIGPETDYRRIDDVLVANLMRRGTICPGPASIGIDARPNGEIVGRDGASSGALYTLGSTMKGVLWEVLAVPDIRVQAQRLATTLLDATRDGHRGSRQHWRPPSPLTAATGERDGTK
jgi:uncharacterized NAD(P)/FAD-binding protein YdhS